MVAQVIVVFDLNGKLPMVCPDEIEGMVVFGAVLLWSRLFRFLQNMEDRNCLIQMIKSGLLQVRLYNPGTVVVKANGFWNGVGVLPFGVR